MSKNDSVYIVRDLLGCYFTAEMPRYSVGSSYKGLKSMLERKH